MDETLRTIQIHHADIRDLLDQLTAKIHETRRLIDEAASIAVLPKSWLR